MFRMVFICTGNQARSVIAERYMRRALEGLDVSVESGGVLDLPPSPPLPGAVAAAQRIGLDLEGHQSRCLVGIDFSSADLVIGFEQQHVAGAVVDGGAPADKSFLMAELRRLLAESEPPPDQDVEARAREYIRRAHDRRLASTMFVPGEELADPAGRNPGFFDDTTASIAGMCDELVRLLFAGAVGRPQMETPGESEVRGGIQW